MALPQGFSAVGFNSGVRRYRPDLGIIVSQTPCSAAGVFTRNSLKAACVTYCADMLPSKDMRAIVVNSGQANAATGIEGVQDNLQLVTKTAEVLGVRPNQVLVASTGVIGVRLHLDKLLPALVPAVRGLSDALNTFALSIMTTDLVPKASARDVTLSGGTIRLVGAAKGSGMIHPNMGTMLGFILTDVAVDSAWLDASLREIADETFNMISVDGETSTNDSVLVLANGASGVKAESSADRALFRKALAEVAQDLAKSIARDGEGASKLITVHVHRAPKLEMAREAARMITTSPLIKSAIHGEDPNWGRILARLGQAGVEARCFETLCVELQGVRVFENGKPVAFDRAHAREKLKSDEVLVDVNLGSGHFEATAWGCDLTKRYVEINTEYS
ncbi:MAG: bifunctional glutamate N-acetyltransferase/amino-acid acetyltransferase ArgJ [Bdellovibrionales bacterium]|nr:bifunctional glutamate N-acetyltransferase/amino-acid acetyltransferase ArgJ [Bdellovibrionales bacterium]